MTDNENTMELEVNPYDYLMENREAPVQSPVILKSAEQPDTVKKTDKPIEMLPMAETVNYNDISIKCYPGIYSNEITIEEELLVPDTYSDVEKILNVGGCPEYIEIIDENGIVAVKGEIKLETMYAAAENYGNNVHVIPSAIKMNVEIAGCKIHDMKQACAYVRIMRIEYRLVNERKYKVKIHTKIEIKEQQERKLMLFDGMEGEKIFTQRDNVRFLDFIYCRTREDEFSENLLVKDDRIRPVKIIKKDLTIAENHRQLSSDKIILNQTVWVRIMYMAENDSRGNLFNQLMFFQGKIDVTEFIPLSRDEAEVKECLISSSLKNVSVEVNNESNGFNVRGDILTNVEFYNYIEKDIVTDFYHEKEEIVCDYKKEKIHTELTCMSIDSTVRESISLQQESGEEYRPVYIDSQIVDPTVVIEGRSVAVKGRIHMEAVVMNEGDYTVAAKKICDFSCMKELPEGTDIDIKLNHIFVREMSCDIIGKDINLTAQIQACLSVFHLEEVTNISNPCIVRGGEPVKCYPLTIHTVLEGETLWDIGKKYKVSEDCILAYNKKENITAGNKIIVVK